MATTSDPTWVGTCRSRWGWPLAGGAAVGASISVVLALTGSGTWWFGAGLGVVLVVVGIGFTQIRVSIDHRGVRVGYGPPGVVCTRIRIDRVVSVRVEPDLVPSRWGGWGYRGSMRLFNRAAVVLRRGPAIVLELDGGKTLALTVDEAEAGAQVLDELRGTAGTRPD